MIFFNRTGTSSLEIPPSNNLTNCPCLNPVSKPTGFPKLPVFLQLGSYWLYVYCFLFFFF